MNSALPEIELRQLRSFVTVAEELHFGRAAERLGIAQPPLSQQIRRLEAKVGCRLFERGTRKVVLTDAGRSLLDTANRVLAEVAEGLRQARQIGRGEAGTVSVGFPATVALATLPAVISAFRQQHPGIDLRLSELATTAQQQAIRSGTIDVGFLREPDPDDGLEIEPVMTERFVAVLSQNHPLAAEEGPLAIEALRDQPFLLFRRDVGARFHDRIVGLCRAAGFAPRVVQESMEWQTVVSLVRSGLGVSIAPESVMNLRLLGAVFRPLDSEDAYTVVSLGWRKDNRRPALRRFVEVVRRVTKA